MTVIWKYPLPKAPGEFELTLTDGYQILHAGVSLQGLPSVWAKVDPKGPKRTVNLKLVFTGEEFGQKESPLLREWHHLHTYTWNGFVFHLLWHG